MSISRDGMQQSKRSGRASFIARHRIALGAAIAAVAAVVAIAETGTSPREAVPAAESAAPRVAEQFEYFPDLYPNQAKRIEDPIATF